MAGITEPQVTQIPLLSPGQSELLTMLLSEFGSGMQGFTFGEPYGGPGQASYSPYTWGGGGMGGGGKGRTNPIRGGGSPMDKMLTEPFVGPSRQAQTGNYPKPSAGGK